MNIDLNKFLTNEEMLKLCIDYVVMDIKTNGIPFSEAFKSEAGVYVTMYCIDKLKIDNKDIDLKNGIAIHSERLNLVYERLMSQDVENGILEPCFNEDGSITYEKIG